MFCLWVINVIYNVKLDKWEKIGVKEVKMSQCRYLENKIKIRLWANKGARVMGDFEGGEWRILGPGL